MAIFHTLSDLLGLDKHRALTGRQLAWQVRDVKAVDSFAEVEFSVFSQFGDDGIIQWLIHRFELPHRFVEFGVEDYRESNTRFLLVNNNWQGLILDSSPKNIKSILRDQITWRHHLDCGTDVVTAENIDKILAVRGYDCDLGILSIDVDGNDYWIWKATQSTAAIVIIEYNSVFGVDRAITIPYTPDFQRSVAHQSMLYFGASLPALCDLAEAKGYDFVGSDSAGNNAYFVRSDLPHGLPVLTAAEGYVESRFAESRSRGRLTYIRGRHRLPLLHGLPVVNTRTGGQEQL
jgi:hypothetical protein